MHCNDAIRGEVGHHLGQIGQSSDVTDCVCIGLLGGKKPRGEWMLRRARGPGGRGTVWSSREGQAVDSEGGA
jgi:hypothetical protein